MANASDHLHSDDLNDYVAECDEHLSAARRVLLTLETAGNLAAATREQLDALFRACHTIKGLSAMVEARAAETAAHELEVYLVTIRNGGQSLSENGVDVLLEGIGLIEAAIAAFRDGDPAPDTSGLIARVAQLQPAPAMQPKGMENQRSTAPPVAVPEEKRARLEAALLRGERAWWVTFAPTPERAARGVNITSVRGQLQAAGEILHAEPKSVPGGVRFHFLLTAPADADLRGWADDGLELEAYQAAPDKSVALVSARSGGGIAPANLVRVDLSRLDDLMRAVGELVLSRARLESGLGRVAAYLPPRERHELEETTQIIERQLRELREGVMRVRMVPVRDLFDRMRLVVRDLTRGTDKEVELVVTGEQAEIDKLVIERMSDPLLHLVRNAVSHGVEPVAERQAKGKRPTGQITLRAATVGGTITLEVEDDGRGVSVDDVFAGARAAGFVPPDAVPDPAAVLDLLCMPGFSTRDEADRGSGRGVGMDVVRLAIESLGGSLTLDSRPGLGSRFTARLPLTLVIADVLTVTVGSQLYAVPQRAVREVVPVDSGATTVLENNELIRYHGGVLPLLRLGDVFGTPRPARAFVALVTNEDSGAVALAADRAVGLREVVVRPLADPLVQAPGIGGATELGDGRPILILDTGGLARLARRRASAVPARTGG